MLKHFHILLKSLKTP